ncbi:hypothetical protein GUITHDRAFT_110771 [Guillardia theta CCMP2712]|uniref:Uncharacterized protein n=1 Tax=Guillardia theta (strain CCMP2712) TaxID=905079 RepID=L1J5G4_GUITC|nr:hypothetical protein GUITHDRAFT_110771 [Guillardia theta CCMP2712]EKX43354.1 hypothetical protein GUITHDRAFT_110771 [Guillardia theta CCMP2712]|eukprot:XP_005830334.1 hypothetical protein GUITHDRAFT_110771 [Guillardia theta CCMP2712]
MIKSNGSSERFRVWSAAFSRLHRHYLRQFEVKNIFSSWADLIYAKQDMRLRQGSETLQSISDIISIWSNSVKISVEDRERNEEQFKVRVEEERLRRRILQWKKLLDVHDRGASRKHVTKQMKFRASRWYS